MYGLDGLLRLDSRSSGTCAAIPEEVLKEAVELRLQLRSRSVRTILLLLRAKGFDVSEVAPSTLNFHLNRLGATKEKHAAEKGTFQPFQKEHANELWQADCSGGIYLPDPFNRGQYKQTHLISFIDDATRLVVHAEFYWDEQLPSLFDCFRKALLTRGKAGQLYTDNGPCFKAHALASACAKLDIELMHSERYTPEGRGKIERHFGTVKGGFYEEAKHSGLQTLEQLNEFFDAWLHVGYHTVKHKSLGQTPFERWEKDEEKGLVSLVTPEQVRAALMVETDRKVNKRTALISLSNRTYRVGPELAGKNVQVRYQADRANPEIEVWLNGKLIDKAREVTPSSDIDYSKRPQRHRQPEKVPKVFDSSKQLRMAMVSARTPDSRLYQGSYLSETEFRNLVERLLERELNEEEPEYLSGEFARLSPLEDTFAESVLLKAISAKGPQMHLRYYCALLMQARLSNRG